MKIKVSKSALFFDFLIASFLTVTLIPLNLTNPEDYFSQDTTEYQDVISDYSLYSTMRAQSRAGDINDQYFSKNFALECFQQFKFDSLILFSVKFVTSKLLSYRLISLPPPTC
jgi:hypothetical protein